MSISKTSSSKRGFKASPHPRLCLLFGNRNCRYVGAPGNASVVQASCAPREFQSPTGEGWSLGSQPKPSQRILPRVLSQD